MEYAKKTPFIFRGDLRSQTGYGRATRSLARLIPGNYAVYGVDLHHNPADCNTVFPGRLISDADILPLTASSENRPIVFTYGDPNQFQAFPEALNLGGFYWETASMPRQQGWDAKCLLMDAFWAPCPFIADCIRSLCPNKPIDIIPWAHDFDAWPLMDSAIARMAQSIPTTLFVSDPARSSHLSMSTLSLAQLRRTTSSLALAIQSLAPRKGLPILLSEWGEYCRMAPSDDVLLLKLSFRHAVGLDDNPLRAFEVLLQRAGIDGSVPARVALVRPEMILSDDEIHTLYKCCDVYLCTSYGEGFGGPVIEALKADRPVITPRHTGLAAMIPENYPLLVQHAPRRIGFAGNLGIYPLESLWNIPLRGSLMRAMQAFRAMPAQTRTEVTRQARTQAMNFCDRDVVRTRIVMSLSNLEKLYATCA